MSRRSTLRPIEAPVAKTAEAPVALDASAPPAGPSRPPVSSTALVAGGLLVAGVVMMAALVLIVTRSSTSPATVPTAAPVLATDANTCPSVASFLDVVTSYERQAHWGLAASTTQTALRTPGLCEADRSALGQKLVTLTGEALFEQPPSPEDAPGQRRVATAYADLKAMASQYAVQPPSPLAIAQSAYDKRLFLLATVAYGDAFTNGDSSTEDRDIVRADYAAQYNLGLIWAQRVDAKQHQDGLARLATACRIDERNQLGSPEACTELQMLLGSRNRWPAPLADPLIDTSMRLTPTRGR